MDRRERFDDRTEALRAMLDGRQASIWTAMPGIIDSFDPNAMTCTVQIALKGKQLKSDGSIVDVTISILPDVPVVFSGGGGWTLTFPVQKGDECLVVFASRCIDSWWQSGDVQTLAELRMHDLSDGFALVGVRSQPNKFTVATDKVELRNDAGDIKATLSPTEIDVLYKANTSLKMLDKEIHLKAGSSTIDMTDTLIDIEATSVKIKGITWETHKHSGVQTGGSNTGNPL